MAEYKSFVGKKLLDILMFAMYPDAKIIFREYIQNSGDAIEEAVNMGILSQKKDGHINVQISSEQNQIVISDNGIGIPSYNVEEILLNIADSRKDGIHSAGQFGIGRLVGAGYCQELSFKTSYKGESISSEITFDVEKTRAILDNDKDHRSASEVIDDVTDLKFYPEDEDNHYFTVTLRGVKKEYPILLNKEDICEYLREVAPIDYSFSFKQNKYTPSLKADFCEDNYKLNSFKLSINDDNDVRKRYGSKIEGTGDNIESLEFFKLEDSEYGYLGWGWFAVTALSKAIPVSDKNRGIRLRKHNILLGNSDLLNPYFKESRGNNYFYGEIHALHHKLKPDSARSGLAPTKEAEVFFESIKCYFESLHSLYRFANTYNNAAKELVQATPVSDAESAPDGNKNNLDDYLQAKKKLNSVVNSKNAQSDVAKKIQEAINVKNKAYPIVETAYNDAEEFSGSITNDSKQTNNVKIVDIIDPLKDKYTNEELSLIRNILKSFSDNCPASQSKLIEELKKKVVKDLSLLNRNEKYKKEEGSFDRARLFE